MKRLEKENFKKEKNNIKILIIVSIVICIVIILIMYNLINNKIQKDKYISEIQGITNEFTNQNINYETVQIKLDRLVTDNYYKALEEVSKKYIEDVINLTKELETIISSDYILSVLLSENISKESIELKTSMQKLEEYRNNILKLKEDIEKFFSDENVYGYLELEVEQGKKVEEKEIKELFNIFVIGDIDQTRKRYLDSISEVEKIIIKYEAAYDFLSENINKWKIEEDRLIFDNSELADKYNELLKEI